MRRWWRIVLAAAALAGAGAVALDRLFPPDLGRYATRSFELRDAAGETLHVALARDGMWRLPATPDEVGAPYLALLLAAEDRRFWRHPGVDPLALGRALWQLATHGRVVSGGSTLTMQVARLLVPHRRDSLGKLAEILRALQLEAHHGKREILAMYLTLAPMGGNVEGVRAAALRYFGHDALRLAEDEAALLVALPQSPERLRPDLHPERAAAAARRILARAGFAPRVVLAALARRPLPALAPHLAERLKARPGPVATTLERPLQERVAALAERERPWLGPADLAALVIRNADRAVLAYLGGADYLGPGGMVDMVRARRSPGSALKPFIYGLAFDDALVAADTLIEDLPLRIGDYAPQNFDRDFHGTVTVREALQQSYNLPAVQLLHRIGPARFWAALGQNGARLALPRGAAAPGLPIALGGLAISLEDLARLYAGLANDGAMGPLRLTAADAAEARTTLMTAAAAREVGAILRETPRPDGVAAWDRRAVAYKTGTSYGFRDAWALGYSERYTVAVWVGRVEGSPRPGAFGRNTSAPLLFKIFDLLPEEPAPAARAPGGGGRPVAPSLRRYAPEAALGAHAAPPRIVYPPAGATLDVAAADGAIQPIALEASGGVAPYRWAVDGVPLPRPPIGAVMSWAPAGPGFVRLSVTDAENRTASAEIRLE